MPVRGIGQFELAGFTLSKRRRGCRIIPVTQSA
jgi:hypothetical protein